MQEPSWIAYKASAAWALCFALFEVQNAPQAQRYLAAAGKPGGPLSLDCWQGKLAVRLYGDLGQDLPCKAQWLGSGTTTKQIDQIGPLKEEELVRQFRQHSDAGDGWQPKRSFKVVVAEVRNC